MDKALEKLFAEICNFSETYNTAFGLKTNSTETLEVRKALQDFQSWVTCEISKGSALFPRVTWIAILPPEQRVSHGVYFVICFGREGAGAVAGCISSVTSKTNLATIKRSLDGTLKINVDGDRATTKYNDAFANPLELTPESFNERVLIKHIEDSLTISLDYIRRNQDPFLNRPLSGEDQEFQNELRNSDVFDTQNIEDTRELIVSAIKARQGQGKFRREILKAYNFKCAITDFEVPAALEAAHIMPYKGRYTNNPRNGLLLRADLHTLFDLNLIAIDTSMTLLIASSLQNTAYAKIAGKRIRLPKDHNKRPSLEALAWRLLYFNT
jgi:putative restriction endonuclease